jgi:hypothetical protein
MEQHMVELIGDISFVLAALALVVFAVLFLTAVRWWTDQLGRSIAGVVATIAFIVLLGILRIAGLIASSDLDWIRAIMYPILAVTTWIGTGTFIRAQFLLRRHRRLPSGKQTSTKGDAV